MSIKKSRSGFSLIELLIAIAIAIAVLGVLLEVCVLASILMAPEQPDTSTLPTTVEIIPSPTQDDQPTK